MGCTLFECWIDIGDLLFSFLVAMGDISLRKRGVEEKRAKAQKESNVLLDYTRKAISRLTYLKRYDLVGYIPRTVKLRVWFLM